MKIDTNSIDKFINNPSEYLLNVKTTKDGEQTIYAEEKGILTWVRAHLPAELFGDYSLKNVVLLLGNLDPKQAELRNSVNSVILRYNLVHPEARIAPLKSPVPIKPSPCLSYDAVMARASEAFANEPLKDAILKHLTQYLDKICYKKIQEEGGEHVTVDDWSWKRESDSRAQAVGGHEPQYTDEERIADQVERFVKSLPGVKVNVMK